MYCRSHLLYTWVQFFFDLGVVLTRLCSQEAKNAFYPTLFCAAGRLGDTAFLDLAADSGYLPLKVDVADADVGYRFDVGRADYQGRTALQEAAMAGHLQARPLCECT